MNGISPNFINLNNNDNNKKNGCEILILEGFSPIPIYYPPIQLLLGWF